MLVEGLPKNIEEKSCSNDSLPAECSKKRKLERSFSSEDSPHEEMDESSQTENKDVCKGCNTYFPRLLFHLLLNEKCEKFYDMDKMKMDKKIEKKMKNKKKIAKHREKQAAKDLESSRKNDSEQRQERRMRAKKKDPVTSKEKETVGKKETRTLH